MKKSSDQKQLVFYLSVGLAYASLWLISNAVHYPDQVLAVVANNLWRIVYIIAVNFLFFEYSVPYVLKKRRYVISNVIVGLVVLWVHLMLWSFGLYAWRLFGIGIGVYTSLLSVSTVESQMAYSTGSVFFFGIIRHLYHYTKLKHTAQQLRIEKQEAELNYLKSQTNPHFLFNTLNNIYALARDKSDLAPESILRLSKILRFMLYETGGDFIPIEQELKVIADYVALESLRYDDTLHIDVSHDVEDLKQPVPPLLLMPLVENAFKHGVSETRGQPFLHVRLTIKERQLRFVVKNSTEPSSSGGPVKENIGLTNLRRQLELLYTDYRLLVQQGAAEFTATLKINLASHV